MPTIRLDAERGVSGVLRVNRVQGVAVGASVRVTGPGPVTWRLHAGFGTADRRAIGGVRAAFPLAGLSWDVTAARDVESREVRPRRSGVFNSVATLVAGDDAGDWFAVDRVGAALGGGPLQLGVVHERVTSRVAHFTALDGTRAANPALGNAEGWRGWLRADARDRDGIGVLARVEAGHGDGSWWRSTVMASCVLPAGMRCEVGAGASGGRVPAHLQFVLGGTGSVPGTPARSITGSRFAQVTIVRPMSLALPFPAIPGVQEAPRSSVSPMVGIAVAGGEAALGAVAHEGLHPYLGVRVDLWGPLLRLEGGWNPRSGAVSLGLDAHPDWWPLL
jgi:hypothetical protein